MRDDGTILGVDRHTTTNNNNKQQYLTWYFLMAWLIGGCGGLIVGYVTVIDDGPRVLTPWTEYDKKTNKWTFHEDTPSALTFHFLYSGAFSCFFNNTYHGIFDVKMRLGCICVMLFAAPFLNGFLADHIFMGYTKFLGYAFVHGRLPLHFAFGSIFYYFPVYMCEMGHTSYHGILILSFQLMIAVGIFLAHLVNYGILNMFEVWLGFRVGLALVVIPASIISIGCFLLPGSPMSMIRRREFKKARDILSKIRGTKNNDDIDDQFWNLVPTYAKKKASEPKISHIVVALFVTFLQQLTGANAILVYSPLVFKATGFGTDTYSTVGILVGGVNVTATLFHIMLGDRTPTRFKLLTGGVFMFFFQIIIWILGLNSPEEYANHIVVILCIYILCYVWSWGSIGLVPNPLFLGFEIPLEIEWARNASFNMASNMIMCQVFMRMPHHFKSSICVVISSFVVLITAVVFFLPETKGLSVEEMSLQWKQHWFWRKYLTDNDVPDEGDVNNNNEHELIREAPKYHCISRAYNIRFKEITKLV